MLVSILMAFRVEGEAEKSFLGVEPQLEGPRHLCWAPEFDVGSVGA